MAKLEEAIKSHSGIKANTTWAEVGAIAVPLSLSLILWLSLKGRELLSKMIDLNAIDVEPSDQLAVFEKHVRIHLLISTPLSSLDSGKTITASDARTRR